MYSNWTGLSVTLVAGVITGSVLVPMKIIKNWPWENIWLLFSICAYAVAPWAVGFATVPNLLTVYGMVSRATLAMTLALGLGWGVAVVLFGLAVDMAGLAISTALLSGSSIAFGSLGAFVLVGGVPLGSAAGLRLIAADAVLILGVLLCAQAGRVREVVTDAVGSRARRGVVISLIAGVLSTLFNVVLVYGAPLRRQAVLAGADPGLATNAIWCLAVTAGAIPSIIWSAYLLSRNRGAGRSWRNYSGKGAWKNALLCVGMGAAWIVGTVLYGIATVRMGKLGVALAWPIYMSATILAGLAWGLIFGEWRSARPTARRLLWAGVGVQLLGISLLSFMK